MISFWFLFILLNLDLAFLKNVEIIQDSPPKITPINESFVYVDYENSVKVKNFIQMNKVELIVRYGSISGRATREQIKDLSTKVHNKQKLAKGTHFVAAMDPCKKHENMFLNFYSDKEIVYTSYKFDYQPDKIALDHVDDWICAVNSTLIYLSVNKSRLYQVKECLHGQVRWMNSYGYLPNLFEGYNEVEKMDEFGIRLYLNGQIVPKVLKNCTDSRFLDISSEDQTNLLLIISISVGSLILVGIILTIAFIMKRRYDINNKVEVDANPDYGIEDQYGNYYDESNIAEGYDGDYEQYDKI